ncbi:SURF1 family protein [Mariniluteicoccus flavus]
MTDTPTGPGHRRRTQALIWTLGLVVAGVMIFLGLWQMSVFRTQGRDALTQRMNLPPVPVASVAGTGGIPHDAYGRPVSASGTYRGPDLLVPSATDPRRCRVVSPLVLGDGTVLPVVRGVSPTCSTPAASGPATEIGVFLPSEAEPARELPPGQLGSVRLPRLAQTWDGAMLPGFVSLDAEHARAHGLEPAEIILPDGAGNARSSGYALQWWIFAAAAVAATVKLSRDAATGSGFMAPGEVLSDRRPVDTPVEE